MKKSILKIGKELNRVEQKQVHGGNFGFSDGECNQQQQSQISCDPYGNGSECDMDAICQGTSGAFIPGTGFVYTAGACYCPN